MKLFIERISFILGKGFIVSFDGFECPEMNTNWYALDTNAMKYSDYDLIMNVNHV